MQFAHETLQKQAFSGPEDEKEKLKTLAKIILSSKILSPYKDHFADLIATILLETKDIPKALTIHSIPGEDLSKSFLADGFLLEKAFSLGSPNLPWNTPLSVL